MKKTKFSLLALAVILGAGAAFASSLKTSHLEETQYYWNGTGYAPAGIEGYDYLCEFGHFSTCTYYFDAASGTYKPSKSGKIVFYR